MGRRSKRPTRQIAGISGAQAAASDLARAQAVEEEHHEEIDPAVIEAARLVFAACETFLRGRRMYHETYPALERFREQIDEKLRAFIDRHGALEVHLTSIGLELDDQMVYKAERVEQNIWFPLFRDGVRRMTLELGLERAEMLAFLDVVFRLGQTTSEELEFLEDDSVTALWDADLHHISYIVIDTYVSGEQNAAADRIREIVTIAMTKDYTLLDGSGGVEAARTLSTTTLTPIDLASFVRKNLAALDEVPDQMWAIRGDLYSIEDFERAALVEGLQAEGLLLEKFLVALVQALVESTGDATPVCNRIEQLFTGIVKDGKFGRATELRRAVVTGLRMQAYGDVTLVEKVDRAMCSESVVATIVDVLIDGADDRLEETLTLVSVLPELAAIPLLKGIARVKDRNRRRAVCEVAAGWRDALEAAVVALREADVEYTQDLIVLARRTGGDRAVPVLESALRHEAPQVRADALRLLAEIANPALVDRRARAALLDADGDVRAAGLELVVARRAEGGLQTIKQAIEANTFDGLALEEKQRLFLAYTVLGGDDACRDLVERLGQRNIMMKASIDDERAAAASVLGATGFQDARSALVKFAKARLVRAHVREACSEALARLDRAANIETPIEADTREGEHVPLETDEIRVMIRVPTTQIPKPGMPTRKHDPTSPVTPVDPPPAGPRRPKGNGNE